MPREKEWGASKPECVWGRRRPGEEAPGEGAPERSLRGQKGPGEVQSHFLWCGWAWHHPLSSNPLVKFQKSRHPSDYFGAKAEKSAVFHVWLWRKVGVLWLTQAVGRAGALGSRSLVCVSGCRRAALAGGGAGGPRRPARWPGSVSSLWSHSERASHSRVSWGVLGSGPALWSRPPSRPGSGFGVLASLPT